MSSSGAASSPSTARAAARTIAEWIAAGDYAVGQRLPSQRALTQQLGISRTSLREALSVLQGQGLLAAHPGKGVYVLASAPPDAPDADAELRAGRWALADVYQLRFALEGFVCRLAALAVQEEDVALLRANLVQMHQCLRQGEFARAGRLDFDFHLHVVAMSGNRAVQDVLRGIGDVILESQSLPFYRRSDGWQATVQEHEAIIEALARGDGDGACRAAQQHVQGAARRAGVHFPDGHTGQDHGG